MLLLGHGHVYEKFNIHYIMLRKGIMKEEGGRGYYLSQKQSVVDE